MNQLYVLNLSCAVRGLRAQSTGTTSSTMRLGDKDLFFDGVGARV